VSKPQHSPKIVACRNSRRINHIPAEQRGHLDANMPWDLELTSASLIGRLGSSTFRLSTTSVSMSLTGSRFSSESAPGPFHHGIRGRGGTIFSAALPSDKRQVQADVRTHLIHRPARDIFPPQGGTRVSSYLICSCAVVMLLPRLALGSSGTRCRQPRYGA
jgi:hypothetical protein